MAQIGRGVSLRGYVSEDDQFTFVLAAGITTDDVGKAVELDTGAANKVKLATDGGVVFGKLMSVEDRTQEGVLVGTVALEFCDSLPQKAASSFNVGDSIQGGGSGTVKPLTAQNDTDGTGTPVIKYATMCAKARVVEVNGTTDVVVVFG